MGLISRIGQKLARRVIWPSATCVLQSRRGCICQDRPSARPRRVARVTTAVSIQNSRCCACNKPLRRCSIFGRTHGRSARFEAFARFLEEKRPRFGRSGKAAARVTVITTCPAESPKGSFGRQAHGRRMKVPGIRTPRCDHVNLQKGDRHGHGKETACKYPRKPNSCFARCGSAKHDRTRDKKNPGTRPGQSNREVHMMTRICDGIS